MEWTIRCPCDVDAEELSRARAEVRRSTISPCSDVWGELSSFPSLLFPLLERVVKVVKGNLLLVPGWL